MTDRPRLAALAQDWIEEARSFHSRQLAKPRKVMRLGKTRIFFTKGQAITTSAAVFVGSSLTSADSPDWIFWSVVLGGVMGGRFVFPVPNSSIASKKGPFDVQHRSAAELDRMTADEIQAYEYNMLLKHRLKTADGLGTQQALARGREAARSTEHAAALEPGSLNGLSLVEAQAFNAAAAQHARIQKRWLAYEVDSKLQFDFPAMSDARMPATAAMIRAMRAAEHAKASARAAEYASAVEAFATALRAAETDAGVPNNRRPGHEF
ncbi:hypothetical protein ACIQC0_02340 [Pseudarthrobacter sp. NPDC092419]|uniref:hypothetical protein n=1 Tax=Pseudarthrobacter sp. NPDC092419 TaxID=3364414 RepID=UPI003816A380